ncbi:MAG: agmatinase [Candidatus Geothermincolia bacterium]
MSPEMAFCGIPTFCKFPQTRDLAGAQAVIVGVPQDAGVTNRPGARFGPRAIRAASQLYGEVYEIERGLYDIELGKQILRGAKIVDYGDVPIVPLLDKANMDAITATFAGILEGGVMPVALGGDHSIVFPILRAFAGTALDVVHLDTHLDFMDDIKGMGLTHTHANPIRRVSELDHVGHITQIGMRGLEVPRVDHSEALEYGCRVITTREVVEGGAAWVLEQVPLTENLYVTVDVDVLDPSVAPGTGTPEPGGLTYNQLKDILAGLPGRGRIVGFDIVEVCPPYDNSEITSLAAARLVLDMLGAILE